MKAALENSFNIPYYRLSCVFSKLDLTLGDKNYHYMILQKVTDLFFALAFFPFALIDPNFNMVCLFDQGIHS